MFLIPSKNSDDDSVSESGHSYSIMKKGDHEDHAASTRQIESAASIRQIESVEVTLLERVGLETGTSKKEVKRMESAFNRFFHNANTNDSAQDEGSQRKDVMDVTSRLEQLITQEFPTKGQVPRPSELIPKLGKLPRNRSVYSPGDWVEIEGLDMKWRLDMITRVIKTAPDTFDWNDPAYMKLEPKWTYKYNAGSDRNVDAYDLRAPESGLKAVFGKRPWVWQQWALLKVEAKMRFQEGHQDDFVELDIQKYASDLWQQWLEEPENADFRKVYFDDRIGDKGRNLLVNHIQKPFNLIDIMGEENKEWDFAQDDNINVFTYLSLYGSGVIFPLLVLTVQTVIPIILLLETNKRDRCDNGDKLTSEVYLAKIMALAVFTYYLFSVIPDTYSNFFNVAGAADTVYSRLLSLRRELWLQSEDSLLQMIGYKLDIYLNTSYETILSMLNIFIILYEEAAIEIILNALAFAFIARIDEDVTKSDWYDPKRRWCTAGAMNVVIQTNLKLQFLNSPKLFSKHFDIPEGMLWEACDGDSSFLHNKGLAKKDHEDPEFMTNPEKIEHMCATIAAKGGNRNALEEYKKPVRYFGFLEKTFGRFIGANPIFERFTCYRAWSRWHKILFLAPVPDLDTVFDTDEDGNILVSKTVDESCIFLENFFPEEDDVSAWVLFLRHFKDVLTFRELARALQSPGRAGMISTLFRVIDGIIFNWGSYFVHIVFPLYLCIAYGETIYNLVTYKCFHPISTAEEYITSWIANE